MYRIKNTADDRSKHLLHRTASQFELEPNLGGHRIRLGTYYDITDEHYERVKPVLDVWVKKGMVDVFPVLPDGADARKFAKDPEFNAEGLKLGGPTFEEWTDTLKQDPKNYPPEGFAEVFSPGLVSFKRQQEESEKVVEQAVDSKPVVETQVTQETYQTQPPQEQPTISIPPVSSSPPPAPPINKGTKKKLF